MILNIEMSNFYIAVIAWDAIVIQFFLIHFFNQVEKLQSDYFASGQLSTTISFIESQELIPPLAKIFVHARAQVDGRRTLNEDEFQELLQGVNYLPEFKSAQEAMTKINNLKTLLVSLQNSAGRIWKWATFHVIFVLCIPSSHYIPDLDNLSYKLSTVSLIIFLVLSLITATYAVIHFSKYDRDRKVFLRSLMTNHQEI